MKTPEEIAELIRDKFDPDYAQKVHPDQQHLHNIAQEVAKVLHVEPSALMINHISGLITQYVERPSEEYPKMLYYHVKRQQKTAATRAEEDELVRDGWVHHHWSAPKPERRAWREPEPVKQEPEPADPSTASDQPDSPRAAEIKEELHQLDEIENDLRDPDKASNDEDSQDKPARTKPSRTKPPRE